MYVVIGGAGMVGGTLARRLVRNRHDVVIVDSDRNVCEQMTKRVGVLAVHGTATDIEVLDEAGIEKAEVAIGALPRDADNLAFTILARNSDVPRIIARMRDPRYDTAYKMAGVTRTLDIGGLFVDQLVLEIEQPTLRQVATFGRGKATVVVATIPDGGRVDGQTVSEVAQNSKFPEECVIAGIYRVADEQFIIPRGGIELRAGDQVFLTAATENARKAAEFLQKTRKK
jgi:trk system potassium uptake protein TrkA